MGRVGGVEGMISSYADVTSNNHHTSVEDTERTGPSQYLTTLNETADMARRALPSGSPVFTRQTSSMRAL